MELPTYLLPDSPEIRCDNMIVDVERPIIWVEVTSTQCSVVCPLCKEQSLRIHSRYSRTVVDLPWAVRRVSIHLHVRRFFCDNPNCKRSIFSERLTTVVAPWARRNQKGWTAKAIAHHIDIHPKTVSRYLQTPLPLPSLQRTRHRLLEPYSPFLLERWNDGCHIGAQLMRELQAKGFTGHYSIVRTAVQQLRRASGLPPRTRASGGKPLTAVATQRTPSLRSLTSLILRDPSLLSETETQTLAKLQSLHAHLDTTIQLAQSFATMVRQHQKERLDPWLEQAAQAGLSQWRSFAQGLACDRAAAAAALETHWSNGPTEGHVNRLKCIKRQMYGRAKLDLLRVRLLSP